MEHPNYLSSEWKNLAYTVRNAHPNRPIPGAPDRLAHLGLDLKMKAYHLQCPTLHPDIQHPIGHVLAGYFARSSYY
jgi:hypothetical protein